VDSPALVLLAGPPGAGKTTVGRLVAGRWSPSMCISSDWFWTTIVHGAIAPWEEAADAQNRAMVRAAVATGRRAAEAGYVTVVEGVLGPWLLEVVRDELSGCPVPVHYVVLRPDLPTCLARAVGRVHEDPAHAGALTAEAPIRSLWSRFSGPDWLARHVVDTSGWSAGRTAGTVAGLVAAGTHGLPDA
jgi:predicted ABC-type ATPase